MGLSGRKMKAKKILGFVSLTMLILNLAGCGGEGASLQDKEAVSIF